MKKIQELLAKIAPLLTKKVIIAGVAIATVGTAATVGIVYTINNNSEKDKPSISQEEEKGDDNKEIALGDDTDDNSSDVSNEETINENGDTEETSQTKSEQNSDKNTTSDAGSSSSSNGNSTSKPPTSNSGGSNSGGGSTSKPEPPKPVEPPKPAPPKDDVIEVPNWAYSGNYRMDQLFGDPLYNMSSGKGNYSGVLTANGRGSVLFQNFLNVAFNGMPSSELNRIFVGKTIDGGTYKIKSVKMIDKKFILDETNTDVDYWINNSGLFDYVPSGIYTETAFAFRDGSSNNFKFSRLVIQLEKK